MANRAEGLPALSSVPQRRHGKKMATAASCSASGLGDEYFHAAVHRPPGSGGVVGDWLARPTAIDGDAVGGYASGNDIVARRGGTIY